MIHFIKNNVKSNPRYVLFNNKNIIVKIIEIIIDILNESLYGNILSSMIFSSFPPSSGSIGRKLYDMSNLFILLIILYLI